MCNGDAGSILAVFHIFWECVVHRVCVVVSAVPSGGRARVGVVGDRLEVRSVMVMKQNAMGNGIIQCEMKE
jgi:hypothetical protein